MQQQAHRLTHPAGHRTSKARQQPSQQAIWGASEQPASHPVSNQKSAESGLGWLCTGMWRHTLQHATVYNRPSHNFCEAYAGARLSQDHLIQVPVVGH